MSESTDQQNTMEQQLCGGGCGFFGSPATSGMCSKCWRDALSKKNQQMEDLAKEQKAAAKMAVVAAAVAESTAGGTSGAAASSTEAAGGEEAASAPNAMEVSPDTVSSSLPAAQASPDDDSAAAAASGDGEETTSTEKVASVSPPPPPEKEKDVEPRQKNKKRCFACNKKVGYTGIECRCKLVFCGVCRYPDAHQCDFDYKTQGRAEIESSLRGGGGQFSKIDRV